MPRFQTFHRIPRRQLWRGLWLALLLLHSPATVRAIGAVWGGGREAASSAFLLSASNLFFLLEILFAPSLRLVRSRRSAIVFLVVVAILHVGIIDEAIPQIATGRESHMWIAAGLGGLAMARLALLPVLRSLEQAVGHLAAQALLFDSRRYHTAALRAAAPLQPQAAWRSAPMRAPPRAF